MKFDVMKVQIRVGKLGWSAKSFAKAAEISEDTALRILRGSNTIHFRTLCKVAKALNFTPATLIVSPNRMSR